MTVRVGIAGCGMIAGAPLRDGRPLATNHAAACKSLDGVELVAAADPDASRRDLFRDYWSVPNVHASVHDMLASEKLDVLVVASSAETHEQICLSALSHGIRGVLCEKPLTGKWASASTVVDAYARANVPLAVNFMRRWDSSHRRALSAIRAGAIGEVRSVAGTYTGTLRGNGSHLVDLVRTLHAPAPSEEWAVAWASRLPNGADDGPVSALLEVRGVRAFLTPIDGAEYFVFELSVIGTRGRIRYLASGNDIRVDLPRASVAFPGYSYLEEEEALPKDTLQDAFRSALEGVVLAATTGQPLANPAADHLGTLGLIESLVTQASSNGLGFGA